MRTMLHCLFCMRSISPLSPAVTNPGRGTTGTPYGSACMQDCLTVTLCQATAQRKQLRVQGGILAGPPEPRLTTPQPRGSFTSPKAQGRPRGASPKGAGETRVQQAASSILAMLQRSAGPLVESQIRCCWG